MNVWKYVCIYVCLYVRTYVCMYVCMSLCMYVDTLGLCDNWKVWFGFGWRLLYNESDVVRPNVLA